MIVVGVDTHKATHTFVGVNAGGQKIGELTAKATSAGHLAALGWATQAFGADLVWGIEDCRNLSSRLERELLDAGQRVVRVPPQLMARTRESARTRGKSDAIDALAVARAVLREPDLPVATHDDVSRELKLLVDRRETLVKYRSATVFRLLWRIHELDPAHAPKRASLHRPKTHRELAAWLAGVPGMVAELAQDELSDIVRLTAEIKTLNKRIAVRVRADAPSVLSIYGCAELTAAKLVGETAGVARFRSEAAFASYAAVTPTARSSGGNTVRMSVGRRGNRQLNAALYRIALVQISHPNPGQEYYRRRLALHDPPPRALRRLQRKIARTVFARLRTDQANRPAPFQPPISWAELDRNAAEWACALAAFDALHTR